ncbi:MAG: DUF1641 domain-containing protein [Nitrospiraceae bacterium]|nr:DUF1641 domain-containing protein [Nitrospiraceae bacterium]
MEEGKNAGTQLAEKLSDPATVNALSSLIDRLTELQATGTMDSFFQAIQAIGFMKDGMTDTMVNKNAAMAESLMEIASEAASPEIMESLKELKAIHRSGKLKDLFELSDNISFMMNSTTTKMLERNAEIAEALYSIAHEAADPSMIEAVRELKNLQKSGNLKTLAEASYMVSFMRNAVTDTMVQRLAAFGSAFVESVSDPRLNGILKSATTCMTRTVQDHASNPPKPGLKGLFATMRDPEVQQGMHFMMTLAKNMRNCMMDAYNKK